MPTRQDKLAAEIEAAEKEIFRNPDEAKVKAPAPEQTVEKVVDQNDDSTSEKEEVILDQTDGADEQAVEKDAQKPQVTDWEERFKSFKQMADATIHGLRQEKLALKEDIQSLKTQMTELVGKMSEAKENKLDISSLFSDDERNLIGEETIKGIEKAVAAAIDTNVKPLESKLAQERELRDKEEARKIQDERAKSNAEFIQRLNELVPNLNKIDTDPKFIEWMRGPDTISGVPRAQLFKNAQAVGDVHRVSEFFLEYARLTAPKKNEKMEEKITPSNQAVAPKTSDEKPKQRKLTMQQIDQFYNDVARGKYRNRPKEQDRMEKLIDAALRNSGMGRKY